MPKFALVSIILIGFTLSGCASSIISYKNRAVSKHDLAKQKYQTGAVFVLTGERRLAVAFPADKLNYRFCPESLPDVASAIGAASTGSADWGGRKLGFSDQVTQALMQTFQRTNDAELLRQLAFMNCTAWAQTPQRAVDGTMDKAYWDQVKHITTEVLALMKERKAAAPAAGNTSGGASAAPSVATVVVAPGGAIRTCQNKDDTDCYKPK